MASPSISRASPRQTRAKTQSPLQSSQTHAFVSGRTESPRRLLQFDLERALSEIQLHDQELQKVRQLDRQHYQDELEARDVATAKAHRIALEAVQRGRDAVRTEAETVLQRHIEAEEAERRRKVEEERQRQRAIELQNAERERKLREEKERLAKAEREKREGEARERERKEAEAREAEQKKAREEEERRQRQEAAAKQAEAEQREEQQRKAAEDAQKTRQAQQAEQTQKPSILPTATQQVSTNTPSDTDRIHQEYLQLYERIKRFKNDFAEEIKQYPQPEKAPVGEGRRLIKANIGKLSYKESAANQATTNQIKEHLTAALANTTRIGRPIPVNELLPPSLNLNDNNRQTIPALAAYLLALLAQQVCKIFTSYVHGEPQRAEPIGICMTSIFGWDKLQFQRKDPATNEIEKIGLFSVLLAKYHKMCPALFGITGDQNTTAGKRRLGWQLVHGTDAPTGPKPTQTSTTSATTSYENRGKKKQPTASTQEGDGSTPKTMFVLENIHYDRMKGLAIGYSAIALRNVAGSSTLVNPYPPKNFWLSLAQIVNMDPRHVQPTHMCVLRYMFGHNGIQRFLTFFGAVGVAVLREAFVSFPQRLPSPLKEDSFTREVMVYVEKDMREKMHFNLL